MNKALYHHLNKNKSHLHDELDNAIIMKEKSDFDDTFGVKMVSTTREKIFKQLIQIFKLIRHYEFDTAICHINNVAKRIKLHFYQLRKLNQPDYETNVKYFTDLMKVCYSIIINCKTSNRIR
tara:strand:- start:568 stop:933 length:366 start_codon:yes stop_codon:yes gene_type:complete